MSHRHLSLHYSSGTEATVLPETFLEKYLLGHMFRQPMTPAGSPKCTRVPLVVFETSACTVTTAVNISAMRDIICYLQDPKCLFESPTRS